MKQIRSLMMALVLALVLMRGDGAAAAAAAEGRFEPLGAPVTKAMLMATAVGPDATGSRDLLYFDFAQTGSTLFLVVVDPDTGEARQYKSPLGPGAWALIRGPDDRMYLGTWESGYILVFDPKEPAKGIQVIGKPSTTETYIWQYALGRDGRLYGGTYGSAKLISFDPKSNRMEDLGRMDDTQMYSRSIAAGPDGYIYLGIGFGKANVVAYNPADRTHRSVLPEEHRTGTAAAVHLGADGQVYASSGSQWFRAVSGGLSPIPANDVVQPRGLVLRDGRTVTVGEVGATSASFTVTDPRTGNRVERKFDYRGDGSMLFVLGNGPQGRIYGSTAMPLEMFEHDPSTGKSKHLGNPTPVNGELYSLLNWREKLVVCAYPGGYLSIYDPLAPGPFAFGTNTTNNPRGYMPMGDGHLRPRAMVQGPDERIYVGSLAPYGQLGGAMAIFDPRTGTIVSNHRHIVTNQSIAALAFEPDTGMIYGATSIEGGGGTKPSASEASVFAFDPAAGSKRWEITPVSGVKAFTAMLAHRGSLLITAGDRLFVLDPRSKQVRNTVKLPGHQLDTSLGHHRDGTLLGLTSNGVYLLDPTNYRLLHQARSPVRVACGFATSDSAVYFGSDAQLWKYVLPSPLPLQSTSDPAKPQ